MEQVPQQAHLLLMDLQHRKEIMAQHFFALMDFKKAFKDAQDYHVHAIQNGTPETKAFHLSQHHKSGNYDILAQKKAAKGKV